MKKLILLSTLVLSSAVFAATESTSNHSSMFTDAYSSKQQAYEAGLSLTKEVREMSQAELKNALPIIENNVILPSLSVDDMTVSVQEYANENGEIAYKAKVNINYEYQYRESNRS